MNIRKTADYRTITLLSFYHLIFRSGSVKCPPSVQFFLIFKKKKKIGNKNAVNLKVLPLLSAQQNTAVFSISSRLKEDTAVFESSFFGFLNVVFRSVKYDDSRLSCAHGKFGATSESRFVKHIGNVIAHPLFRNAEFFRNFRVREPARHLA